MSLPISLVIITKNEAANIQRCLESVPFADDIVVLDSGSTDDTCEIARGLGANVVIEPWRGFGPMKRRAVELAKNDWILSLDADEALDVVAQEGLRNLVESGALHGGPSAYKYARQSFHLGRWIKHGGWSPDEQIRLFNRKRANWNENVIHEKVEIPDGSLGVAPGKIRHWVFKDLAHQIDTNNRYSGLGAEDLDLRGKRFSLLKLIFKPWSKFMETYVFKGGFMDGLPGLIISVGAAYSVFLKFSKLWELQNLGPKAPKSHEKP